MSDGKETRAWPRCRLGRWARESPLFGRKHPWVSRPGGQMQGNAGLRKHPVLPPGTGRLPSAFLFRISIYYLPLPSAWPHLPANLIIHFLLTAGASWSPDLREQGNQAVAPPCVLELFSKAPGFSRHPPITTGPTCTTDQLDNVLGILLVSDLLLGTRGTEEGQTHCPKEARVIDTSSRQILPTYGALQTAGPRSIFAEQPVVFSQRGEATRRSQVL